MKMSPYVYVFGLMNMIVFPLMGDDHWVYRPLLSEGVVYTNYFTSFAPQTTEMVVSGIEQRRSMFVDKMMSRGDVGDIPIIVIGDVFAVDIVSLNGFDLNRISSDCPMNAWGVYRIEIAVRRVEKGAFEPRRFVFLARCGYENVFSREADRWIFYRGMTLRIGMNQKHDLSGDNYAVAGASPCKPYAPFSLAPIAEPNSDEAMTFKSILFQNNSSTNGMEFPRLLVRYNDNDIAMFVSDRSITQLPYQPVFDFNAFCKIYVRASRRSPAYDYWKYSWSAESPLGKGSGVVFVNSNLEEDKSPVNE